MDEINSHDDEDFSSDMEDEEFRELVKKRSQIEDKMNCIDEMAKQVKLALELQKSMTDCYSNHVSNFPLETSIEIKFLATGSSIAVFSVRNNSKFELKGWSLSLNIFPTNLDVSCIGSFSQSAALVHLAPGEEFTSELFIPHHYLQLPTAFHLNLTKVFCIQNEEKYICIDLGEEFISIRDHIHRMDHPLPAVDRDIPNALGNFTLRLPYCLVDLLSGCPDDDDPVNALRILLPRHRFQWMGPGTSSTNALLVLSQSQRHPLRMEVTRDQSFFIVSVTLRDSALRNRLRQAFQMYLIHKTSRILKRPSSISPPISNCNTLDELYDNVMLSFST